MDRSNAAYLLLHYSLLIGLILGVIEVVERSASSVPFWLGIAIAVAVGLVYPRVVAAMGIAPERWER